ncbi:carbamate kinase [Petrotoga sp. HWH.PT.55.6.1]|jgi:carbamate kinase|uniref:carbamate kinase n=1 Tax=unclassified Petrotoga TaxID=2620614 RepID=UPI000CA05DEA|nr:MULTISPECIES: carbamate kinase [unclassified Petrotoga]MBL5981354.1 carbamate kinase [Petrotoga sp. 8T1HF07.NaAc.6.1]PNR93777.1 carbamate kinase [Petrotoga sp. HWHPT.55.6.3]RPD36504.1 carbamate kinase [Petrotoga sp. HWH.PT.55.6.1]
MTEKLAIVAIGGNALSQPKESPTAENMLKNLENTAKCLVELVKKNYKIVITHGNGPQVGNILVQQDIAKEVIPPFPLDVNGAMTQGYIGYMISQMLKNVLTAEHIEKDVSSIVTQVLVDKNDPAFNNPSKPIGPFYTEEEANTFIKEKGWSMVEDAGRGWRRVVPSPEPLEIVEIRAIKQLVKDNNITIAAGGGGIPVVKEENKLKGVEGVIDKDRASALLAIELDADEFIILTAVEKVFINFNKPNQQAISSMTVNQAIQYMKEGHFSKGSMLPKIEACTNFVLKTGRSALITDLTKLVDALEGKTGTIITK